MSTSEITNYRWQDAAEVKPQQQPTGESRFLGSLLAKLFGSIL